MVRFQLKYKIFGNKRSVVIDEALPLVALLILFVVLVGWTKVSEALERGNTVEDIQKQNDLVYAHEEIVSYLKRLDDNGNNKIDFLSKNYNEKNYDAIRSDLESYFRPKFSHLEMWRIELYDSSGNDILKPPLRISDKSLTDPQLKSVILAASISIPVMSTGSPYLTFKIYFGRLPK